MTTETIEDIPLSTRAEPAGFWIRLAAALIDFLVLLPAAVLGIYFTAYRQNLLLVVLVMLLTACYKPVMEHIYGGTLGKLACNLRVTDEHGAFLSLGQAWLRYTPWLVATVLGLYLNYAMFGQDDFREITGYFEYVEYLQNDAEVVRLGRIQQYASLLPLLSALVMLFNPPKQAAHDILAGSFVVRRPS
ncbi:RDD family protein [Lewinella sp. JB7]|uniref:RDD family protein n=1 Tax=Lewinella sp. JB7 TaxID=2962887 RepID=UPI0020C9508F|nr:RDD family protein [Lewinella sp. JB7]MCP9235374.1 RDD family protein [Lewinella sp. JB7]